MPSDVASSPEKGGIIVSEVLPSVLVVDDDPAIRKFLVEALSLDGYPVETASGGREALEKLKKSGGPRVVLLDLLMPDVDGWAVMRGLEADPPVRARHRIILMSALATLERARDLKADGELQKPFTMDQLLNLLAA
jgi:CheY-like chemotaxis protein